VYRHLTNCASLSIFVVAPSPAARTPLRETICTVSRRPRVHCHSFTNQSQRIVARINTQLQRLRNTHGSCR
jgi:hypothetical protein